MQQQQPGVQVEASRPGYKRVWGGGSSTTPGSPSGVVLGSPLVADILLGKFGVALSRPRHQGGGSPIPDKICKDAVNTFSSFPSNAIPFFFFFLLIIV